MQIRILKEKFETWGSRTLVATVYDVAPKPCPIELLFEQTTTEWKRKNGGPEEIIVTEHLLMCFIDDILILQKMGYEISVGEFSENWR